MKLSQLQPAFDVNIKKTKVMGTTPLTIDSVSPNMGETLKVYGKTFTELDIPEGYQLIQYLTCDGTQIVWTGIAYNSNYETTFIAKACSDYIDTRTVLASWGAAAGNWIGGIETWRIANIPSDYLYNETATVEVTWVNNVQSYVVNGEPIAGTTNVSGTGGTYESRGEFRLFSNSQTTNGSFSGRFYIGKLLRENAVLGLWLPCRSTTGNNEVGIFDVLHGTFIAVAGTVAGPDITVDDLDSSIIPERFYNVSTPTSVFAVSNFQITSNNETVCTVPVTLNGMQGVEDEFDLATGQLTQNFGELVLTGQEDWKSFGGGCYFASGLSLVKPISAFCNAAFYRKGAGTIATLVSGEFGFLGNPFNGNIAFKNANTTDVTTWKTYLSTKYNNNTPVKIIYSLPEPNVTTVTPVSVTLLGGTNTIDTSLDTSIGIEATVYSTNGNDFTIGLHQGYIKSDGSISTSSDVDHNKYVTTDFIYGGKAYCFRVKKDYVISSSCLYDKNGNVIKNDFMTPGSTEIDSLGNGRFFSKMITKKYLLKLTVRAVKDNTPIDPNMDIGDLFEYITSDKYVRASASLPSARKEFYDRGRARITKVTSMPNVLKKDLAFGQGMSGTFFGAPYASTTPTNGVVGCDVSKRTFLTAINNKHSVMYTESPVKQKSSYGYTYPEGLIYSVKYYYGNVCVTIPSIFCNTLRSISEKTWRELLTVVPYSINTMDVIQPMDIGYHVGHVIIVLDKIYDLQGNLKFFEYAEAGGGDYFAHTVIITPEDFFVKLGDMVILHDNDGSVVKDYGNFDVDELTPFLPADYNDDYEDYQFNNDICTFKGDYVSLVIGDKVWLNIKGQNWNKVKLYKNNVLEHTFDITTAVDTDEEYWADLDLTSYFTIKSQADYYTATAYDSVNDVESEPCHFEMMYVGANNFKSSAHILNENYQVVGGMYCDLDTSSNITVGKTYWVTNVGGSCEVNNIFTKITSDMLSEGVALLKEYSSVPGGSVRERANINLLFAGHYHNYQRNIYARPASVENLLYTDIANKTVESTISTSGAIVSNSAYSVSTYIAVEPNTDYAYYFTKSANNEESLVVNEYSTNTEPASVLNTNVLITNAQMSNIPTNVHKKATFTTGANTHYIKINMCNNDTSKMLCSC